MEFHLIVQGEKTGPYPAAELRARVARGELTPESLVWRPGMAQPQPLREVAELAPQPPPLPPLKLPVSGKVSIGAAALAFALLVPGILVARHSSNPADGGQTATLVAGMSLLTFGGLAGFIGAVLGLVALVQRGVARRTTAVTLAINLVILTTAIVMARSNRGALFGALFNRGDPVRVARRPIPVSASAKTRKDFQPVLRAWYERNLLESYLEDGRRSPAWDEAGTNLIRAWIAQFVEGGSSDPELDIDSLQRKVRASESQDPLLIHLSVLRRDGTRPPVTKFFPTGYPAAADFFMNVGEARYYYPQTAQAQRRNLLDQTESNAVANLKQALTDGGFRREETRVLAEILVEGWAKPFFDRNGPELCEVLAEAKDLESWLAPYARGEQLITAAWSARGGGYANTVSNPQWQAFSLNLQAAARSLETAWKLGPKQPEIAVAMMRIQLGEGNAEGMRAWFDQAVRLEFDYPSAYRELLWGLRPRWYGSHAAMVAFGEACLATKRFDTEVPGEYFTALREVASERDDGDALFAAPEVYQNLVKLFDGCLAARTSTVARASLLSDRAIAAYLAGKFDDSLRDLETLDFRLSPAALRHWSENHEDLPLEVAARTGPARAAVKHGEEEWVAHRPAEALTEYRLAAGLVGDDRRAARFIQQRISLAETEQALAHGEWIDFLPPADLSGWQVLEGTCRRLDDGSLEIESAPRGYRVNSLARVGPDFELTGEMEVVRSSEQRFQGGVIFGLPAADWWSFRFIKEIRGAPDKAELSHRFLAGESPVQVVVSNRNSFSVKSSGGAITASLNGTVVLARTAWPVDRFAEPRDIEVGLGAYNSVGTVVLRYRNVKLRRLPAPAPDIVPRQ